MNRESSRNQHSDQDIADFYASNKQQFNVAEPQYRVAQIVVTAAQGTVVRNRKNDDSTNEAESQPQSKNADGSPDSGADFATLAMVISFRSWTLTIPPADRGRVDLRSYARSGSS